jgi:dTMP kinase
VPTRGKYIVIEGQDATGKTTQADLLQEYLQSEGKKVIHIKEPGGSPISEELRRIILDGTLARTPMTNILLFTAIRHELWNQVIKPALEAGTWVICTRNYYSTLAYQAYGEGSDPRVIGAITQTFTDKEYMHPDHALILYFADTSVREKRLRERGGSGKPDAFETRDADFQNRVNEAYLTIAKEYGIQLVDATRPIDEIQTELRKRVHHLSH